RGDVRRFAGARWRAQGAHLVRLRRRSRRERHAASRRRWLRTEAVPRGRAQPNDRDRVEDLATMTVTITWSLRAPSRGGGGGIRAVRTGSLVPESIPLLDSRHAHVRPRSQRLREPVPPGGGFVLRRAAEEEGFEPTVAFRLRRFSKPVP